MSNDNGAAVLALRVPDIHRAGRWRLLRWLGRWLCRLGGWRIRGDIPSDHHLILAVGPHTSNWDFVVGVAAMLALDIRIHWLGKHSLFVPPLGWLMRALGGIAVDRSQPEGVAEQTAERIRCAPQMLIAITPEGTRSPVAQLKTGFSRMARFIPCDVVPVTFDYRTREIRLHPAFEVTADPVADAGRMREIFADAVPRRPENF